MRNYELTETLEWLAEAGAYVACGRFHWMILETAIQEVRTCK